jgi:hypothetical protein
MHLPHYAVTTDDTKTIHLLAQQPVDTSKPAEVFGAVNF